jgi:predicted DNA-binding antitoxin AbrB/MazE fold protein
MFMQAYQGYIENGLVVPLEAQSLPEGRKVIVTVLDEEIAGDAPSGHSGAPLTRPEKLRQALDAFVKALNECEPLPEEFEVLVGQLVILARRV